MYARANKILHALCIWFFLFLSASAHGEPLPVKKTKEWKGDLNGMIERRYIRALVVPTRLQYWVERGRQSGATYEALAAFEAEINKKYKTKGKHIKTHVVFIPTARDELIPALKAGRGDIAAGGLTITDDRLEEVDFGDPLVKGVKEIVVTGPASPPLGTLDDLAGEEIFVRKSSSYWSHLEDLNQRFKKEGHKPVKLRAAPEDLQDDDLLEMLNAGLFRIAVVDSYKATLWGKVLPKLQPRPDLVVNEGGEIAWMIRKNSPQLKAAIDEFARTHGRGTTFGNTVIQKYVGSTKFVKEATSDVEMAKFDATVDIFRKHSQRYEMDYLLMMAQGYQESRLDQNAKSHVGAIGVMQVMPPTGKDMNVGDIALVDPNIHAGVKYIRFLQDTYFAKETMDEVNQTLFAFAAYNAGPGRVRHLRAEASKRGLDPNVWFNNVELVAAEKIGSETVTYVANIYKYYVAYTLMTEHMQERARLKEAMMR